MRKEELIKFLERKGWSENGAKSLFESSLMNKALPMKEWKKTFVGAFCSSYTQERIHIARFLAESIGVKVPDWGDFSRANIAEFRQYLLDRCSANSAKTYLAMIRSVFGTFSDEGLLPSKSYGKEMRVRKEPSQHVALTEEELELVHKYVPKSVTEADVKRDFMIEALSGARSSDVKTLTEDNIVDGWLVYISQKTKTETKVPTHKYLLGYLKQKRHSEHNRACVISVIQRICRKVGITNPVKLFVGGRWQSKPKCEFCGTHTGRRTFATCLATRGVPIPVISKMMGHATTNQTSRYIAIEQSQLIDSAKAFFG